MSKMVFRHVASRPSQVAWMRYAAVLRDFHASSYVGRAKPKGKHSKTSLKSKEVEFWAKMIRETGKPSVEKKTAESRRKSVKLLMNSRTKRSIISAHSSNWNAVEPHQYIEEVVEEIFSSEMHTNAGEEEEEMYSLFFTALENLVVEINRAAFNKNRNHALLYLKDQLVTLFKEARNGQQIVNESDKNIQLEDIISPNITKMHYMVQEIWYGRDNDKWPANIVEQHDIDLSDITSKYRYLLRRYYEYCLRTTEIIFAPLQTSKIDLSNPARWYPLARQQKRHVIMHVGPTNSGKTYQALKRLEEAKVGFFAGPLRLLAREVYERFKDKKIPVNLHTGEESILELDAHGKLAGITCGTVEMFSTTEQYDVVVLDEIQMIADENRGSAWTAVLLGARAREIHLCGEERAVPLVRKICELTGDTLLVNTYKRLGRLEPERLYLGDKWYINLRKGDCVVAFSKQKILQYRALIEQNTDLSVSVIYGALPAETRIEQAANFNMGKTDILVASDAVGMGLNLSIKRIVFTTLSKFDGLLHRPLTAPEIKQISGRAGRYKTSPVGLSKPAAFDVTQELEEHGRQDKSESVGYVAVIQKPDVDRLKSALTCRVPPILKACLWAPDHIWGEYISEFPSGTLLANILIVYSKEVESSELFFTQTVNLRISFADLLENTAELPMVDKLALINSPYHASDMHNMMALNFYKQFCNTVAESRTRSIFDFELPFNILRPDHQLEKQQKQEKYRKMDHFLGNPKGLNITKASEIEDLQTLELFHRLVMLYCWLSYRYPHYFVDRQSAMDVKHLCEYRISEVLAKLKDGQTQVVTHRERKRR